MTSTTLLDAITGPFIASAKHGGFNGVVAIALLQFQPNPALLREELSALIQHGEITAVFSRLSVNMHIKRFPDLAIDKQLELLGTEPIEQICLYPSASTVAPRVDLSAWHDRPFSKALLLVEAQLAFRAFDLGALERYVADPRYDVRFEDYMGYMSVTNERFEDGQHPERDKVSLQSFGLGFDEKRRPYIVIFLRYLANLTAEHQQYWNSYLANCHVYLSEAYHYSSIEGQFPKNHSVRYAIVEEMRLIRSLSDAIWGKCLFKEPPSRNIPIGLSTFLRPTANNFNRFIMELDKLLSESIDVRFFEGKVSLEEESKRPDGKIVVRNKGTIALLQEWLLTELTWKDEEGFRKIIIQPFRDIRRLRQKPAHAFTLDQFAEEYYPRRKKLLWSVFNSLSNIRRTFATHPKARAIEIPNWLDDGGIDVF